MQGTKPIECDKPDDSTAEPPQCKRLWLRPLHFELPRWVQLFRNSFNFWPGPNAESQLNWICYILFAMATYGVVFHLLALVQCSARAHCLVHNGHLTSPVTVGILPDSDFDLLTRTPPKA